MRDARRMHGIGAVDLLSGAGEVIRTPDLLITNQLLYQLSYSGANAAVMQDLQSDAPGKSLGSGSQLRRARMITSTASM